MLPTLVLDMRFADEKHKTTDQQASDNNECRLHRKIACENRVLHALAQHILSTGRQAVYDRFGARSDSSRRFDKEGG